ncbi:MAG: DUF1761 domain-containing protein [Bacteroidetes bacterium]|nr:MAG: DUF1761 domain-containing protein [Bacteroidota bacterium]
MHFEHTNFLAVGVCALMSFGLGALWYSPILFGKTWQRELGFSDEYLQQGNMPLIFGSSFVMMLLMMLGLAMLMAPHGENLSLQIGLHYGLIAGVLFVAPSVAINALYQRHSLRLWAIDAGYQALFIILSGLILGAWH